MFRSDNGDVKLEEFVRFCRKREIRLEYTAPYSPQQNGIAKGSLKLITILIKTNYLALSKNRSGRYNCNCHISDVFELLEYRIFVCE